ncbi:type II secretion system GspH family protein [Rhodoferax sp. U11-2br]|uniref:type II secretion system GspH family protein n=1 Tax=Rhodoferax sp. U11-2br TaxID=2838878 RepID=UPI001BE61485|nr:type II secretion system GspH family protein [Rhodoferax sp. U11-2br]MBT3067987.1 type II secretion system GspH family protein [Rhodoferax sp. U11-2br]
MHSGKAQHSLISRQRGFGYLLVLFALAAMGLTLAGAGQVWHTLAQREKETQLLFVGNQFRQAIGAYYAFSPGEVKQYPAKLEDLLEDKRFPMPRRYLRQLYRDPMTGGTQWGLVKAGDRILGVHSLSEGVAFRTVFEGRDASFTGMTHYNQWVFGPAAGEFVP